MFKTENGKKGGKITTVSRDIQEDTGLAEYNFYLSFAFETRTQYIALGYRHQAGLKLKESTCPCFPSAGIKGMYHYGSIPFNIST